MNRESIQMEHDRLGYQLGWRFMMSPEATYARCELAVVGLNPGGSSRHGPDWSCENGNAYWTESWRGRPAGESPLQRQVQVLARLLGAREETTFAAQFIPFRSPRFEDLAHKDEAVAFSRRLWEWRFSSHRPQLIACLGKGVAGPNIADLIGARLVASIPAAWGNQTIDRYEAPDGRVVIAIPHLGTFKLMGRPASEAAVREAAQATVANSPARKEALLSVSDVRLERGRGHTTDQCIAQHLLQAMGLKIVTQGPSGRYPCAEPGPRPGYRYWATFADGQFKLGVQAKGKDQLSGRWVDQLRAAGFDMTRQKTEVFMWLGPTLAAATLTAQDAMEAMKRALQ